MKVKIEMTVEIAEGKGANFSVSWYGVDKEDIVDIEGRMIGMLADMHRGEVEKTK